MNKIMIEQTLSIIKPDAVERNLEEKIKIFFENKNLKILKNKKVQKMRQQNFIKCIKQNLFMENYAIIYLLDRSLLLYYRVKMQF